MEKGYPIDALCHLFYKALALPTSETCDPKCISMVANRDLRMSDFYFSELVNSTKQEEKHKLRWKKQRNASQRHGGFLAASRIIASFGKICPSAENLILPLSDFSTNAFLHPTRAKEMVDPQAI